VNKAHAIMYLFPNSVPFEDFVVSTNGSDEQNISYWGIDAPIPSEEELTLAWEEYERNKPPEPKSVEERLLSIESRLEALENV
jgi:hypothetical protein